jgi:hypothetical protein
MIEHDAIKILKFGKCRHEAIGWSVLGKSTKNKQDLNLAIKILQLSENVTGAQHLSSALSSLGKLGVTLNKNQKIIDNSCDVSQRIKALDNEIQHFRDKLFAEYLDLFSSDEFIMQRFDLKACLTRKSDTLNENVV